LQISSDEMRDLYAGIERERSQLECIVLALPQAVFVLDESGAIRTDNPAAERMVGARAVAGVPLDDHLTFAVHGRPTAYDVLPDHTPAGSVTVRGPGAAAVPVEVQRAPLENGELITLTDLTERLREQADLHEAQMHAELAQRAERVRGDFLARMSHELRTPLNAIIGYSELLQDDVTQDQLQDVVRIHGAGSHLLALINDILDLSKVDAGHMELRNDTFELQQTLVSVRDTLEPLARQQGARVEVDCPSVTVHMDEGKLKQCLFNLAGNAIRYSPQGKVLLRVSAMGATRIRIDVEDTGAGIPAHVLPTLFEPFKQAPGSQGGTGLGLTLVRSLSERMGGHCEATSAIGVGSCFTLFLPTQAPTD